MAKPRLPLLPIDENDTLIPPALHRIWVGGKPPAWVRASWERQDRFFAQSAHDWWIVTYTDGNMPRPLAKAAEVADFYGLPPRGKADLMRVVAVSLWGGFYLDADVVPLRSLDDLVRNPEVRVWTTSHAESREQQVLWNGGFAAHPHSAYMADILAFAQRKLERGVTNEHFLAGPRAYRSFLPAYAVTEWDFQFEASSEERRTMASGGEFDLDALRAKYPARLKHIGPKEDQ